MPFRIKKPCVNCPFRTDIHPYITKGRAFEIAKALLRGKNFHCHKTVDYDNDSGGEITDKSALCAGAMILMTKEGKPNQMMQITERLKFHDFSSLDLEAPVYDTFVDFIEAHRD